MKEVKEKEKNQETLTDRGITLCGISYNDNNNYHTSNSGNKLNTWRWRTNRSS